VTDETDTTVKGFDEMWDTATPVETRERRILPMTNPTEDQPGDAATHVEHADNVNVGGEGTESSQPKQSEQDDDNDEPKPDGKTDTSE
jgi:hypothetical protein